MLLHNLIAIALLSQPSFAILDKGSKAPFTGILFDDEATAILMTDGDTRAKQAHLEDELVFKTKEKDYQFKIDDLKLQLETSNKEVQAATDVGPSQFIIIIGAIGIAVASFLIGRAI